MIKRGWHFCKDVDGHPVLRDNTPCLAAGGIESYNGSVATCVCGLHWSERALDALFYAPGPWVRLVEGEPVEIIDTEVIGNERRILTNPVNVSRILRGFAGLCAMRALRYYTTTEARDACMPAVHCALIYWHTGVWPEERTHTLHAAQVAYDAAWNNDNATMCATDSARCASIDDTDWVVARSSNLYAAESAAASAFWRVPKTISQCNDWRTAKSAELYWQNQVLEAMLMQALKAQT